MDDQQQSQPFLGKVFSHPLVEEIKRSYLDYAMSVIVGRALPDARDGLKPVQRRVLYAMMGLGIKHNQGYKKSARVVGETMGKYHPHGDASIYDTMVRLAQKWNLRYPLVDGQGNFGSIDGDSAAAMRYTEARFAELGELMLQDIDEDTVDWGPNFDESLKEPLTLPSLVPNLLVNGSTGIAVGMATNIPSHNLGEVVDALCKLIGNPEVELDELMSVLPGPDFATGGTIMGREGIVDAYRTGRGKIIVRGKCHEEHNKRGKLQLIITEIPYMVNKTALIEDIVKCIQEKEIDGVQDLRDESDRQGLRIVLDLYRDTDSSLVQRQLFSRTQMQTTFGVINLALVDMKPVELNLKAMLQTFLDYRRVVVRRRTQFRLNKAMAREHIVQGLCKALDMIDAVIAIIRGAKTVDEAKKGLVEQLEFSALQADAILDMRLQRLTGLERDKLLAELSQLMADIERYKTILNDTHVLDGVIRDELLELRRKFGDKRRTEIVAEMPLDIASEDLMPEEDIVVTLSKDGYLRRTLLRDYNVQGLGGKGRRGAVLHEEDQVAMMDVSTTHRDIYLFTSRGRTFAIKGHVIPETKTGKGKPIGKFISLNEGETVVALKGSYSKGDTIFMITRRGIAKRMDSTELDNLTRAGRIIMTLDPGDEIAQVRTTAGSSELLFVSRKGRALRVEENEFRSMGRSARGVKAMELAEDDAIVSCEVVCADKSLLLVTENGIGKRTSYEEFSLHHRATSGMRAIKLSERTGKLAVATSVGDGDQIVVITTGGHMVRLAIEQIRQLSRSATGVIIVRFTDEDGEKVADISVIRKGDTAAEANANRIKQGTVEDTPVTDGQAEIPLDKDDDTEAPVGEEPHPQEEDGGHGEEVPTNGDSQGDLPFSNDDDTDLRGE